MRGKITEVFPTYVTIALSQYVKGRLYLEHMSEVPIKTIPPKLQKIGKEVTLRVWTVDAAEKRIEFTKKESLMKDSAKVYENIRQISKGDKVHGVIVAKTQHGFVVKTFSGISGLLTFGEISKKAQKKDLKEGSFLKTYVLFKKNGKLALTTNKKANAEEAKEGALEEESFDSHLPETDELKKMKKEFKK
jgi:ribosomal protein S1